MSYNILVPEVRQSLRNIFRCIGTLARLQVLECIYLNAKDYGKNPELTVNEIYSFVPQSRSQVLRLLNKMTKEGVLLRKERKYYTYSFHPANYEILFEFFNSLQEKQFSIQEITFLNRKASCEAFLILGEMKEGYMKNIQAHVRDKKIKLRIPRDLPSLAQESNLVTAYETIFPDIWWFVLTSRGKQLYALLTSAFLDENRKIAYSLGRKQMNFPVVKEPDDIGRFLKVLGVGDNFLYLRFLKRQNSPLSISEITLGLNKQHSNAFYVLHRLCYYGFLYQEKQSLNSLFYMPQHVKSRVEFLENVLSEHPYSYKVMARSTFYSLIQKVVYYQIYASEEISNEEKFLIYIAQNLFILEKEAI